MIKLKRQKDSHSGTHGILNILGEKFHTMEPPWLDNKRYVSCVPTGLYRLIPFDSPKYGPCYLMVNETLDVYPFTRSPGRPAGGRALCLFVHKGNYPHNFKGCIGAGDNFLEAQDMITNTRATCEVVNDLVMEEGSFQLTIT